MAGIYDKRENLNSPTKQAPSKNRAMPIPATDDNQFWDNRVCMSGATSGSRTRLLLGIATGCDGKFIYLEDGVDMTILGLETPDMSLNADDMDTGSYYVEQINKKIEEKITLPIQLKGGGKFEQLMEVISQNESDQETNGKGIVDASNGGISLIVETIYNEGSETEYRKQKAYVNLFANNWYDDMPVAIEADTTFDFELRVQRHPIHRMIGILPAGYGIPTKELDGTPIVPPTIEIDSVEVTTDTVTIGTITLNDPNEITENRMLVTIFDKDGKLIDRVNVTGSTASISGAFTDGVFIQTAFEYTKNLYYATECRFWDMTASF